MFRSTWMFPNSTRARSRALKNMKGVARATPFWPYKVFTKFFIHGILIVGDRSIQKGGDMGLFSKKKKAKMPYIRSKTITSIEELKSSGFKAPFVFTVFDTETNGLTRKDGVLSVSAQKWFFDGVSFIHLGDFERFYFPKWFLNKAAVSVNGLTRKVLRQKRKGHNWPRNWYKDIQSFAQYVGTDTDLIVGHNSSFDRKFYSFMNTKKVFCTMYANIKTVGSIGKNGRLKVPKLLETARHYGIEIEEEKLHLSYYDVELTTNVFMKMVENEFVPVF